MYNDSYQDPYNSGQTEQPQTDQSSIPAYPYLMSGQPGWPNMSQPTYTTMPVPTSPSSGDSFKAPTSNTNYNNYGTSANLDPNYIRSQIEQAYREAGVPVDQSQVDYYLNKSLSPEQYSDGRWRVGWNNYWRDRMINGGDSADPNRAGMEGVIQNPGAYGLGGGESGGGGFSGGGFSGSSYSSGSIAPSISISGNYGGFKSPQATTLWDMLMGKALQSTNINPKDPIIKGQVDAASAQQRRVGRNYMADLAEREGPTSNLNLEGRMQSEREAQSMGSLQASLMQNELSARRNEIMQSMQLMGGMLSDEQRIALQKELGLIDANLAQQRITNQNNQFLDDFAFRNTDRSSYWDALRRGLITG